VVTHYKGKGDEHNMFCSNCGTKQGEDIGFCSNCGTKIGDVRSTQNKSESTQPDISKEDKNKGKQVHKMPSKRLITILIVVLFGIALILIVRSCGGDGETALVGRWEGSNHEWEFFSDGTIVVAHGWGDVIGSWSTDGNRLVISGLSGDRRWINGSHTFNVSRNTFTFELDNGNSIEFTRVR